jgi:hypothetical protein
MLTRSMSFEQVKSVVNDLVHKVATQTRVKWDKVGITKAYTYIVDDDKKLKPSPLSRIKQTDIDGSACPFTLPKEIPIMKPILSVVPSYPKVVVPSYPKVVVPSYPKVVVPSYPKVVVPSYPIIDHPLVRCQLPHARPVPISEIYDIVREQGRVVDYDTFIQATMGELEHGVNQGKKEFDDPVMQQLYG